AQRTGAAPRSRAGGPRGQGAVLHLQGHHRRQADLSGGPLPVLADAQGRPRRAGLQQGLLAALRVHLVRDLSAAAPPEPPRGAHRGGRKASRGIETQAWHPPCTCLTRGGGMGRVIIMIGTAGLLAACTTARTEPPPPTTTTTQATTTSTSSTLAAMATANPARRRRRRPRPRSARTRHPRSSPTRSRPTT